MAHAVELEDLLKGLDLSRADGRAGLGTLLREIDERLNVGSGGAPAGIGGIPVTTVYNARTAAGLDHMGVACGD